MGGQAELEPECRGRGLAPVCRPPGGLLSITVVASVQGGESPNSATYGPDQRFRPRVVCPPTRSLSRCSMKVIAQRWEPRTPIAKRGKRGRNGELRRPIIGDGQPG